MPEKVWLLNLIVFAVLLEADLGRRKISWFRVARPLLTTAAIIPLFVTTLPAAGHNLALQAAGAGVGVILGLAAHLFIWVGPGPATGTKSPTGSNPAGGQPTSRAGSGYAAFWAVIFAARLVFIYGTYHWFTGPLGQFLAAHQLSAAALSNALVFMAIAMALARSALLGGRGLAARRRLADSPALAAPAHPAATAGPRTPAGQ